MLELAAEKQQADNSILRLCKAGVSDDDLTLDQLPQLDLYMDQIISLLQQNSSKQKDLVNTEGKTDKKILTKTMINNYSKAGLLLPIKGKKYSPAHVLQMQLIDNLKQSLALGEIKDLFGYVEDELVLDQGKTYNQDGVKALNQDFLNLKSNLRLNLPTALADLQVKCKQDTQENFKLQEVFDVLFFALISVYAKNSALEALKSIKNK